MKLSLQHISKKLGNFQLNNISLDIKPGEYFVVLGPSGAGKSVLFDIIAGIRKTDTGHIFHNNLDITHASIQNRNIGLVFQENTLFPHMNVRQNISYPLVLQRKTQKEKIDYVEKISIELKISHLLERNPETLSGGEQKRVLLARTLALEPDILLLDEPLSSLDTYNKFNIQKLLKNLNKKGLTVLHITHDYHEALFLADRIAFMFNGKINQCDIPSRLFSNPENKQIAGFLGIENYFPAIQNNKLLLIDNKLQLNLQKERSFKGKVIIPSSAIKIQKTEKSDSLNGIIEHIVNYPEKTDIYIKSDVTLKCSIHSDLFTQHFKPGLNISFTLREEQIIFI